MQADIFSKATGLNFGQSLHLHPYFGYTRREGSGESALLRRLVQAFVAQLKDKFQKSCTGLYILSFGNWI